MCLMALAWQQSERFPLVLAANRDEFTDRPAAPMAWWQAAGGGPALLSGRDLRGGGTWLGLTAAGRLGLLTNVRLPGATDPQAPTRGHIVTDWLARDEPVEACLERLRAAAHAPYNFLAADLRAPAWHWISRTGAGTEPLLARALTPGLLGLSNAALDTPWPKVLRLKQAVAGAITRVEATGTPRAELLAALFQYLGDEALAADEALPSTGVPLALERMLSAIFVRSPDDRYRTRCSTVLVVERCAAGLQAEVVELNHDDGSRVSHLLPAWPPTAR